jgi:hypothetical protein
VKGNNWTKYQENIDGKVGKNGDAISGNKRKVQTLKELSDLVKAAGHDVGEDTVRGLVSLPLLCLEHELTIIAR